MTEADELEKLEREIEEHGKQIKQRCDRALEILRGRWRFCAGAS